MPLCQIIVHALGASACLGVIAFTAVIIIRTVNEELRHARR